MSSNTGQFMLFVIIKMILNAVEVNLFIHNSVILKSQNILGSEVLYLRDLCITFQGCNARSTGLGVQWFLPESPSYKVNRVILLS